MPNESPAPEPPMVSVVTRGRDPCRRSPTAESIMELCARPTKPYFGTSGCIELLVFPGSSEALLVVNLLHVPAQRTLELDSRGLTVFAAETLPVTICRTSDAFDVYETLMGSDLFAVPCGSPDRLAAWPPLKAHVTNFEIEGEDWEKSCADIVFSSAGWVAITPRRGRKCIFQAWTPEGRGIYLRQPALLPYSVNHRGKRISGTPAYLVGKAVKISD